MNHQQLQLADLARLVQGECVGQADLRLSALASLEHATSQDLAFVNADKYVEQANQSQAKKYPAWYRKYCSNSSFSDHRR